MERRKPAPGRVLAAGEWVSNTVAVAVFRLEQELGDQPRAACKDVLGADLAIADGVELVDVSGFALRSAFDHPFTGVVVFVGLGVAVIGNLLDAVFFVPEDRPAGAV